MAKTRHSVSVPRRLSRKIAKVEDELREHGVSVEFDVEIRRKAKSAVRVQEIRAAWDAVTHAWLVFTILREAIGAWPKIRKILVNAGLTSDEITVLGLSKLTRKPTPTKKLTKARRRTR